MRARRTFRPRLRDTVAANMRALQMLGATDEDIAGHEASIEPYLQKQRGPRKPRDPSVADQTEAPVIAAVSELLATHPQVAFACRQNAGAFTYQTKAGRTAPVFFFKLLKHSKDDLTLTDFWGFLQVRNLVEPTDGLRVELHRVIPFAIEAKRPSWKEPREPREFRQAAFIMLIRNLGGVGGFVRSADEAARILEHGLGE